MPYRTVVDVMLILARDGEVLLAQRQGTGYADGTWNVPSGKLEADESAADALVREVLEEIGLRLDTEELRMAGVVHCRNPEGEGRLGLFFAVDHDPSRHGEPFNAEPHKCAQVAWFPADQLPPDTVPYTSAGVALYLKGGDMFSALGWDAPPW